MDRRKATDPYLSFSCASPRSRNSPGGYPNLYCTSCWMPDREQSTRRCPVPVPCTGIKRSFASKLTLREHNCYCQLKELKPGINEPNSHARHACVPVSPAVKTISAPVRCSSCKYTKIGPECKAYNHTQAEACFPYTISEPIMVSMHCFNLVDRSRPLQPGSTLSHTRGCLFSIINPLLIHNYGSRAILKMNLWDAKWCGIFSG